MNMTTRALYGKSLLWEDISFLLTNHIPHHWANRLFGWFSQIEAPLLTRASIAIWRLFGDLDLSDARIAAFPEPARLLHARAEIRRASIDRDRK